MIASKTRCRRVNARIEIHADNKIYGRVDGKHIVGNVRDLSYTGARIDFAGEARPRLCPKDAIDLMFGFDAVTKSRGFQGLAVHAKVCWVREDSATLSVGVEFDDLRESERMELATYVDELLMEADRYREAFFASFDEFMG